MVGAERRRGRELVVEVNISGRSAGDPELLALIERELTAADVDPHQIIFEITETIAVSNIPRAQHFAARLAEPRLPLRARRLRRRLRLLLLPQAPAVRLPQDRRRVRAPLGRRHDRPARDPGRRRHRARPRQAHDRRARRRPRDDRAAASHGRRPRPGLPPRRARSALGLAARGGGGRPEPSGGSAAPSRGPGAPAARSRAASRGRRRCARGARPCPPRSPRRATRAARGRPRGPRR